MKKPIGPIRLALGAAAMLFLVIGAGLALAAGGSVSIVEQNGQYKFRPASLTVAEGTTVTWTNNSDAPHTVTADGRLFDSGQVDENGTFEQTFSTAGEFAYHCAFHDYMHGTVRVLAAGQTPPPTDTTPAGGTGSASIPWLPLLGAGLAVIVLGRLGQRALVARERP